MPQRQLNHFSNQGELSLEAADILVGDVRNRTFRCHRRLFFKRYLRALPSDNDACWLGGGDHKSYRIAQHFDPERLALLHWTPLEESHEIVFPTDDTHRLGGGQRDLDGRIRFCLANDDLVVDAHVCVTANVTIDSDYAEAAVFWVCRPHHCGRSVAAHYLDDVATYEPELSHGIHVDSGDTSSRVAMIRLDDFKRYFFYHFSMSPISCV